jgi:serine/threonine protein kinase
MGIVYKAEDATLERTVALKFLAQHLLNDEEAKERFLREAKAASALSHPNICTVYEIAEVDGKTFIAMEFVKGETLEERIAAGPLTLKDALDVRRQVADGLEAAHEENIIHRDIKPANVMVDAKGRAKVMDFGLARLTEASRLTKTNTAMGTVAYMSPEHAQGFEVDTRTDIWALGCVLYEMISGQRPFQGQYDQALLYEIVHEEPTALTGLRTGVPVELEFIVNECLAKDRDDRTGTAQEVSRKLRTLAEKLKSGHSTILRTTQMTGAVPATMTGAQTVDSAEALPPGAVIRAAEKLEGAARAGSRVRHRVPRTTDVQPDRGSDRGPETPLRRFSFTPPPGLDISPIRSGLAISPNGRHLAFTTTGAEGAL